MSIFTLNEGGKTYPKGCILIFRDVVIIFSLRYLTWSKASSLKIQYNENERTLYFKPQILKTYIQALNEKPSVCLVARQAKILCVNYRSQAFTIDRNKLVQDAISVYLYEETF